MSGFKMNVPLATPNLTPISSSSFKLDGITANPVRFETDNHSFTPSLSTNFKGGYVAGLNTNHSLSDSTSLTTNSYRSNNGHWGVSGGINIKF